MTIEKQDSNVAGLFITRETANRVRSVTPVFQTREPNTFSDIGGDYTTVARRPFNPSRQRQKGTITDLDASAGWNEDVTMNNLIDTHEGFCFAAKRPKALQTNIAAVASTDDYTVASSAGFHVGSIIRGVGFANPANNGLHVLNAITDGTHISTADALTDEAANPNASVQVVGYQFPVGDVSVSIVGGVARFTSATIDCTTLGLIPGEFVFQGGDAAGNQLANNLPGYARVAAVAAGHIDFDKTTFAAAIDAGAGKLVRLFFGTVIRNENDPSLIVKYTHTVERTLGSDADGRQSEYVDGFVYNEMTWNSPLANKLNVDIKGQAMSHKHRPGSLGPLAYAGGATIVPVLGEDAVNTSSDVYRLRMAVIDPATLNPSALFARVSEWTGTIKNNVTGSKAQGTLGAFDSTAGMFEVDLKLTAYFADTAAVETIPANADVTYDAIYAKQNQAIVIDYPLISNAGGKLTLEMDKPIMIPLTSAAAESDFGHTILFTLFPYVPTVGMPSN